MPSYVELQSSPGVQPVLRVALPDDITRDIAFRQDHGWIAALHAALMAHRPRGCEQFVEALDTDARAATVLFEMPARSEGDPPIHVVRWAEETPATSSEIAPSQTRASAARTAAA